MKLRIDKKEFLTSIKYSDSFFKNAIGLMFASKKKCKQGMILDLKYNQIINLTNLFVFYKLDILFIDSNHKVVEKTILSPFQFQYKSKAKARYVVEALYGTFSNINISDSVKFIKS